MAHVENSDSHNLDRARNRKRDFDWLLYATAGSRLLGAIAWDRIKITIKIRIRIKLPLRSDSGSVILTS